MKELKTLPNIETDLIKAKANGSKLYLQAITHHEVFDVVTNHLLNEVGGKYSLEVKNIVASSISSFRKLDSGISYSRDKKKYSSFNKSISNRKKASYRKLFYVLDKLEELGYVELYKGYKDVEAGYSMSSCILFNDQYIRLFNKSDLDKYGETIEESVVVVRDENGETVNNIDTEELEDQVLEINHWLNSHCFKFGIFEKKIWLKRVFNNDLNTGGRFFFGHLQTIQSDRRPSFIIDNTRVADLDFSAMHYNLIATLNGIELPYDFKPYGVDISDLVELTGKGDKDKRYRNIVKFACLLLINSGNPSVSLRNAWKQNILAMTKYKEEGNFEKFEENMFYGVSGLENCSKIIERLVHHNTFASNYFFKKGGCWGEMQNLESKILLDILLNLKARDIPVLPYHDGLLCQNHRVPDVVDIMKNSWKSLLGNTDNCKIERKY